MAGSIQFDTFVTLFVTFFGRLAGILLSPQCVAQRVATRSEIAVALRLIPYDHSDRAFSRLVTQCRKDESRRKDDVHDAHFASFTAQAFDPVMDRCVPHVAGRLRRRATGDARRAGFATPRT